MLKSWIVRIVELCIRCPSWTIVLALALGTGSAFYTARHFAIHTDIHDLISPDLPWAQRALQYMTEFPQAEILVVIDAPTAEFAEQAATTLAQALQAHPDRFRAVGHPGSGSFFEHNGLLFLKTDEVQRITEALTRGDALLGTLAGDPSLRGSLDALSLIVIGVQRGEVKLDDVTRVLTMAANTVETSLAGKPAVFSWRA